jgi:hypothetical protein
VACDADQDCRAPASRSTQLTATSLATPSTQGRLWRRRRRAPGRTLRLRATPRTHRSFTRPDLLWGCSVRRPRPPSPILSEAVCPTPGRRGARHHWHPQPVGRASPGPVSPSGSGGRGRGPPLGVGHRVRLGHRALASFLRAVAEARSPQLERCREETRNAGPREIYLTLLPVGLATCMRLC